MPRKDKGSSLGRSLLRRQNNKFDNISSRHTTDFGSQNTAISITENTSIDEFLSNAEAAQRSFEAERGRSQIVQLGNDLSSDEDLSDVEEEGGDDGADSEDDEPVEMCLLPKKPLWNRTQSTEDYQRLEQTHFLKWKRHLNKLERKHKNLPPFEKNLEFWRQLWKIVEISDVVVQVVDARDPLFYHCRDLHDYVLEVSELKVNIVLLNKADLLTAEQRMKWSEYFAESDIKALFFSALGDDDDKAASPTLAFNSPWILSPLEVLETIRTQVKVSPVTVGFLGYPNVGKSSTINRFLTNTKLQVSATPGKTKHYQTHVLEGSVTLVDGPGLVIPNFDMSKAAMVLAGILPIDNLTGDALPTVELLLTKIPFGHIQKHYGIMRRCVDAAKKSDRKSESAQVLSSLALMRGFMKPGGVPDGSRAARVILKDLVQGRLLYCRAPPGVDQDDFFPFEAVEEESEDEMNLEDTFPELKMQSAPHVRGVRAPATGKGDKKQPAIKKRKEKARRMFKSEPYA